MAGSACLAGRTLADLAECLTAAAPVLMTVSIPGSGQGPDQDRHALWPLASSDPGSCSGLMWDGPRAPIRDAVPSPGPGWARNTSGRRGALGSGRCGGRARQSPAWHWTSLPWRELIHAADVLWTYSSELHEVLVLHRGMPLRQHRRFHRRRDDQRPPAQRATGYPTMNAQHDAISRSQVPSCDRTDLAVRYPKSRLAAHPTTRTKSAIWLLRDWVKHLA